MRRKISASAEILVERVRVQPAKKYTRTTTSTILITSLFARARLQRRGHRKGVTRDQLQIQKSAFYLLNIIHCRCKSREITFSFRSERRSAQSFCEFGDSSTQRYGRAQSINIIASVNGSGCEVPIPFGRLLAVELTRRLTRSRKRRLPVQVISGSSRADQTRIRRIRYNKFTASL